MLTLTRRYSRQPRRCSPRRRRRRPRSGRRVCPRGGRHRRPPSPGYCQRSRHRCSERARAHRPLQSRCHRRLPPPLRGWRYFYESVLPLFKLTLACIASRMHLDLKLSGWSLVPSPCALSSKSVSQCYHGLSASVITAVRASLSVLSPPPPSPYSCCVLASCRCCATPSRSSTRCSRLEISYGGHLKRLARRPAIVAGDAGGAGHCTRQAPQSLAKHHLEQQHRQSYRLI